MSNPTHRLTVTSYAILGQLALRSWTTYALIKEMRRNFHYFWPRAESAVYAEIKRLAAAGLVRAERTYTGRRARTTYEITPAGRQALADWLATPPKDYVLEFEGLLRVFFARFGTVAAIHVPLEQTRTQAAELLAVAEAIALEYHEARAPFQEQIEVRALVHDFLASFAQVMQAWAMRAAAEAAAWEGLSLEERQARGRRYFDMVALEPAAGLAVAVPWPEQASQDPETEPQTQRAAPKA